MVIPRKFKLLLTFSRWHPSKNNNLTCLSKCLPENMHEHKETHCLFMFDVVKNTGIMYKAGSNREKERSSL